MPICPVVRGVKDILVQILPKAPNWPRGRPFHTVRIFDGRLTGRHLGKVQNGRHPGEISIAI